MRERTAAGLWVAIAMGLWLPLAAGAQAPLGSAELTLHGVRLHVAAEATTSPIQVPARTGFTLSTRLVDGADRPLPSSPFSEPVFVTGDLSGPGMCDCLQPNATMECGADGSSPPLWCGRLGCAFRHSPRREGTPGPGCEAADGAGGLPTYPNREPRNPLTVYASSESAESV